MAFTASQEFSLWKGPTPRPLAGILVDRLLAERPVGGGRARIMVNGLGRVKYEELFVLYLAVAEKLDREGVELTEPEVGEFVTSLDMAGCSVTLVWTDDELEELLSTAVSTPGYTHPGPSTAVAGKLGISVDDLAADRPPVPDDDLSSGGRIARRALAAVAVRLQELETHLGDLDAVAADGDHGTTMTRGIDAAVDAAGRTGPDAAQVLTAAGMAFADAAGGASGALWGSGLTSIGRHLESGLAVALEAARDEVIRLGGSEPGDKTLVDALEPFVATFRAMAEEGHGTAECWTRAAEAAEQAARRTADLVARRGRAARLPERSIGTEDPGAVSLAAALTAVGVVLSETEGARTR